MVCLLLFLFVANYFSLLFRSKYVIFASSVIRRGQVYRIAVTLTSESPAYNVTASIERDRVELASGKEEMIEPGESRFIFIQVTLKFARKFLINFN